MGTTEAIFRLGVADSHPFELYKEMYLSQSAEIVMFGDSHVANGVFTTDKVLNLGYAGNNMNAIVSKVLDYVEKSDVEYIGLQADPHLFSYYRIDNNQSEHLDSLLNDNETILYMFRPHLRKYLLDYWKSWISNPVFFLSKKNEEENSGVSITVHSILEIDERTREKQASIRVQSHRPIDYFETSEPARQLSNTIEELLDLGKHICLISYPVSSDYRKAKKTYIQFKKAIDYYKMLSELKNIKYLNYSDRYEDSYFSDIDHLNLNGRKKFTKEVIDECFKSLI
jgi:hypothetical protein